VRQQASEETVPGVHLVIGVVEDSDDLRESLVELLATCGHRAVGFSCAEELLELNHGLTFELMVLDLNLPGEDGLSLARRLR
jgi:two-component system phosphate regulon response regulator OmpR